MCIKAVIIRLRMKIKLILIIFLAFTLSSCTETNHSVDIKLQRSELIKKHLKRLKKVEGGIKLIGGREEFEGNVEIFHNGKWGAICDDEWDAAEADVICRQLGYPANIGKATHSSQFGHPRRSYWLDNVYCDGSEEEVTSCRHDEWGVNDCQSNEAAGVICYEEHAQEQIFEKKNVIMRALPSHLQVRLQNGRVATEGRVEVKTRFGKWAPICGNGWSLLEASVVCRSLSMGYASDAMQTDYFGGNLTQYSFSGITCRGNESSLRECLHDFGSKGKCENRNVAAVSCVDYMADLVVDYYELMTSAHLEDSALFFLQCAMEENCLASQAYRIQRESPDWQIERRRLLRFTAKILNAGTADFRPLLPKHLWEWHMCHMHYHSMEVFATFDIYNKEGKRVAEGHKASFCLEDNQCLPGVNRRYACANYGDQGISVNCSDIYRYSVDCQWVDISEIIPGIYTLKVAVNPEFKIPEISYENNAAVCEFYYSETSAIVTNCTLQRP